MQTRICYLQLTLVLVSTLCNGSKVFRQIANEENIFAAVFGNQTDLLSTFPLCILESDADDGNETIELRKEDDMTAEEFYNLLRSRNSSALSVDISMSISQLLAVSEKEQTISLAIRTFTDWTDCRLAWSAVDFNMVKNITVQPEKFRGLNLFVPLVILLEETNPLASQSSEISIKLNSTGGVSVHREYTTTISCALDVKMYPFDCHSCNLTFETPFNSLETNLKYSMYESVEAESRYLLADGRFIPSDTWEVIILPAIKSRRWSCSNVPQDGKSESNSLQCFVDRQTYRIILRRHPHYQVVNLLIPAFLCLVLSTCIFMIPPGATDKLFLMLTILLSLFIFLNLMYDKMPETGSTLPWMSLYYFACTVIVSISCVVCSITTTIAASQRNVPGCLVDLVKQFSSLLIGIIPKQNKSKGHADKRTPDQNENDEDNNHNASESIHMKEMDSTVSTVLFGRSNSSEDSGDNHHQSAASADDSTPEIVITWVHVAAFFDRVYLILVLVLSLVLLALFLLYGYFPPSGLYGMHLGDADWPYVRAELALQGDSDLI